MSAAATAATPQRQRVALLTGVTGQDGSYLTELLLAKGYVVHGIKRRASSHNQPRLDEALNGHALAHNVVLHYGDLSDATALAHLMREVRPDEVYNLGAQSHVAVSFKMPKYTAEVDALGTLNLLEAIRLAGLERTTRFYQASTSEMYGKVQEIPQRETTPFYPRSPYACAKLCAHWLTVNYRESYDMFAVSGILFNHESPRRGEIFVTRKITRAVAAIAAGRQACVVLGNLDAQRDWGHARDYVAAMWSMLQVDTPQDFVIATGETRSVRVFCEAAFAAGGFGTLRWEGAGLDEVGIAESTGAVVVRVLERYYRPAEVDLLIGDPSKAVKELGFNPRATSFQTLVEEMVKADMAALAKEIHVQAACAAPPKAVLAGCCAPAAPADADVVEAPAEEWGPFVGGSAAATTLEAASDADACCAKRVEALESRMQQLGA